MSLYERDASDLSGIRACADAYGFCLVRNVFTEKEVSDIKTGMKVSHEAYGGHIPDLVTCPPLRGLLFDARILGIARELLGNELVYYPESAVNYEAVVGPITLNPYSVFHCDALGRPNELYKRWHSATDEPFRGYRFGLYLQDYEHHSGGLKLGIGSHRGDPDDLHKKSTEATGREMVDVGGRQFHIPKIDVPMHNVPSRPGDVVVWNLRTFHAAGARLLRNDPTRAFHPDIEKSLQEKMPDAFLPIPGPRLTIFFDLAAPTEDVDLYIKSRTHKFNSGKLTQLMHSRHDKENLVSELRRHGIRTRFDYLLTTFVVALMDKKARDPQAIITRILTMADQHEEFSPYFPLFDRARYLAARKESDEQAFQVVYEGVTQHVEALANARKK